MLPVAQADDDVPHDELLERPAKFRQALRLRHKVVLQALSAEPFAFLEDDRADGVLSRRPRFAAHADGEVITAHGGVSKRLYGSSGLAGFLAVSGGRPTLRERDHACLMIGPVVKGGRVKVSAVRQTSV